MNTEIKSIKGDLPEANSQLNGMWEEIVRRYNMHEQLISLLRIYVESDDFDGEYARKGRELLRKSD